MKNLPQTLGLLIGTLMLAACGSSDGGEPITEVNTIDAPGTYTREFGLSGLRRGFLLYVPTSADLSKPVAVVMVLHGNPPIDMRPMSQMDDQADSMGFVAVYPQSWNRGEWAFACGECNLPAQQGIDDVAYFRAVIQVLQSDLNIDSGRIYISGFSMGGLMTTRLACDMGNQLAAVAIIGSIGWDWQVDNCPGGPIPTIWFIGTLDNQFPWAGTPGAVVSQLSAEDFRVAWAQKNGCPIELPAEQLLPDLDPTDGTTAVLYEHEGCAAPFNEYKFEGMGHNWPGSPIAVVPSLQNRDIQASGTMTRFFFENSR